METFRHPKSIFLSIFCLVSLSCFGQSDFQEGYYITLQGDTIHGLIDNRGEIRNSKLCIYQRDESSDEIKFAPDEIKSYRFKDSKYYISKRINTSRGEEQVFVEFLVNGITDLYFFRDPYNYLYAIEYEDGELLELFKKTDTLYIEGRGEVFKESNNHIRLLKATFADCMEIQPQINQVQLTHKSLIKLTKDYHNYVCEDEQCIIYEKQLPAIKIQVAPIVGYTVSNLRFDEGFYSRFSYDQNSNPSFGIQVNAVFPRIFERISYQLEVLYNNNDVYGMYRGYYQLYINNALLQPSLAFKYNSPKGKIRPTFAVGVASNFILNPEINAIINDVPGNPPKEVQLENIYLTTNLFGGFVQIGCNYNLFKNLEMFSNLKYTRCVGGTKSESEYIRTIISSLNVSVGFYLVSIKTQI